MMEEQNENRNKRNPFIKYAWIPGAAVGMYYALHWICKAIW